MNCRGFFRGLNDAALRAAVEQVVHEIVSKQTGHLKRGRVERTFTTDLANGLKACFGMGPITVDSFYNRHRNTTKRLDGRVIELDIAIHERGVDDVNLIAIELETNNAPERNDVWKIEKLTDDLGDYGYRLGLFLVVGIEERAGEIITMEWYKNGRPCAEPA